MAKKTGNRGMKRLRDEQQVRQRPGVIFGTNDEQGALNGINEIVDNSIDEAREGHGSVINYTVERGEGDINSAEGKQADIFTIEDQGRGLPMDWNEDEGMYDWELALCTMYASGKYDSEQYTQSLGLNGLGLTSMQYASAFMDVYSAYDNKLHYMHFEKGRPVGEMKVAPLPKEYQGQTGTRIRFQPDVEVFPALRHKDILPEIILISLRKQAMQIAGLTINFTHYNYNHTVTLCYKGGIIEYIDSLTDKLMLNKTVYFEDSAVGTDDPVAMPEEYKVNMKMAFNFSRGLGENGNSIGVIEIYHNSSHMFEGGTTVQGFEKGLTQAFTDVAKATGKIGKSERFAYSDIADIMLCVCMTGAPGFRTSFKNQTKGAITNPFIGKAFAQFVYDKMRYWLEQNPTVAGKIVNEVVTNKKAREEGAEVSKKVINKLSKAVSFGNKPKDFKDCSTKVIRDREIYIVEGRSALGSVKLACNPKFQAVLPLRGKPINCLKEKLSRILNNDVITDLYRVLQCGIEAKSDYIDNLPKFDILKLNWGKIIICTDADVDGMHIRCLLILMFLILSPSLLKYGKVYIAETPLFEINWKKEKRSRFAFNDAEKEAVLNDLYALGATDKEITVQRSKGLGENDPEMMSESTMNPLTRRLVPVEYPDEGDEQMMHELLNALLGDDIESRRELIEQYFEACEEAE